MNRVPTNSHLTDAPPPGPNPVAKPRFLVSSASLTGFHKVSANAEWSCWNLPNRQARMLPGQYQCIHLCAADQDMPRPFAPWGGRDREHMRDYRCANFYQGEQ